MNPKCQASDETIAEGLVWFFWAAPAAIGIAATVFNAPIIGLWNLIFGLVCFGAGVVTLISLRRRRLLLALLLLSNFLLAFVCISVGLGSNLAGTGFNTPIIGLWSLSFGLACVVAGVATLISLRRRPLLLAMLLLSNFPLVFVTFTIGLSSNLRPLEAQIDVVNKSTARVDSVVVSIGARSTKSGGVAVGATRRVVSPPIVGRGDLLVVVAISGKRFSFKLFNVDSDDISGVKNVDVFDDGIRWTKP